MEDRKILILERCLAGVTIILSAMFVRLVPHPPNFTPIGAMSLFAGQQISGKKALLFPLLPLFLTDIFLGFHTTMPFVYGSYLLIVFLGRHTPKDKCYWLPASLIASVIFFLVTNFGAWLTSPLYPKTAAGLISAYILGLPFFRYTAISDFLFTSLFFSVYFYSRQIPNGLRSMINRALQIVGFWW